MPFRPSMMGSDGSGDWNIFNWSDSDAKDQIFGTVSHIEGNKITITDNGGKDRIVFSGSNTVIMLGGEVIGLLTLAEGQSITAFGTLTKDGELAARAIRVSTALQY